MREIENTEPLERPRGRRREWNGRRVALPHKLDRRRVGDRATLRMRAPLLGASQDRRAEAKRRKFVLERLRVKARNALGDGFALVWAVEIAQYAVAQMLIGAIEENVSTVAGTVEIIHRRMDDADVELPAALKEISDLVEQQAGVPPIDRHALRAEAATLADRGDCCADRAHQRDGEVMDLDGRVDIARRLIDVNRRRRMLREVQSLRDRRENFFLPRVVQVFNSATRALPTIAYALVSGRFSRMCSSRRCFIVTSDGAPISKSSAR